MAFCKSLCYAAKWFLQLLQWKHLGWFSSHFASCFLHLAFHPSTSEYSFPDSPHEKWNFVIFRISLAQRLHTHQSLDAYLDHLRRKYNLSKVDEEFSLLLQTFQNVRFVHVQKSAETTSDFSRQTISGIYLSARLTSASRSSSIQDPQTFGSRAITAWVPHARNIESSIVCNPVLANLLETAIR